MSLGYDDLKKEFPNRMKIEDKKLKSLLDMIEKGKAQLETEKKTYCVDMKK